MFLHYPPTNILERDSTFTRMAEEYGAEQVIYAHCHGEARFHDSIMGTYNGVRYSLVSGDFRNWMPMTVLEDI
jgi:predicted phosphohydrolase